MSPSIMSKQNWQNSRIVFSGIWKCRHTTKEDGFCLADRFIWTMSFSTSGSTHPTVWNYRSNLHLHYITKVTAKHLIRHGGSTVRWIQNTRMQVCMHSHITYEEQSCQCWRYFLHNNCARSLFAARYRYGKSKARSVALDSNLTFRWDIPVAFYRIIKYK